MYRRILALVLFIMSIVPCRPAAAEVQSAPVLAMSTMGAPIADVTIETYGVVKPAEVFRYLSLRKGETLEKDAVDRDYLNLTKLGGFKVRMSIAQDPASGAVTLHWIVMAKAIAPTYHPYYLEEPLSPPIEGVGFVGKSRELDSKGSDVALSTEFTRRADIVRGIYTRPLRVDPVKGRESQFLVNVYGGKGDYRASEPYPAEIYSWSTAVQLSYLQRSTNGTQLEFGVLSGRSSSDKPTYIVAPSMYDTYYKPARNTLLEAGVSHACPGPPTQWYPPYCYYQFRARVDDGIGGLGSTNEFQAYNADVAQYTRVGSSTFALHGALWRSGGVIPTSFINCAAGLHGYPKAFCGTDSEIVQAEYRIDDALPHVIHFFLLGETAASRVRGGNQYFVPSQFTWHSDYGYGVMYRTFRFDITHGAQGGRITYEFQGQLF